MASVGRKLFIATFRIWSLETKLQICSARSKFYFRQRFPVGKDFGTLGNEEDVMRKNSPAALAACVFAFLLGVTGPAGLGAQESPAAVRRLSLAAFLEDVVHSNRSVQEGFLQWLIKTREARAEWGAFEPILLGSFKEDGLRQQNTALESFQQLGQQIYDQKNDSYSLGIQGNLPTGGSYNVGTSVTRLQDTYVEQGQFKSFVGVSAQQPLLKGLTHGAPFAAINTAFEDRIIAFQQYRRQLMTTISQAETSYWNLAFAQEASRMNSDSVQVARNLLETAQEGARLGRMSDLDVREAEAELASRVAAQEDGELSVTDALNQVKGLMGNRAPGSEGIEAADPLVADAARDGDAESETRDLLKWAERAQPDFMIESEQLRRELLLVGYQQDQTLPELNLSASYGYSGLGLTPQSSLDSLDSQGYPTWSFGLELRVPLLLGVKQRNGLEVEELKRQLAEVRVKAVQEQMSTGIASLVHSVGTLRAHVDNARTVTEVKNHLLDVQLARLKAGAVGLADVYTAEDALRQARQRELEAVVRSRQAVMDLERASGTVLRNQGLEDLRDGQVQLSQALRSE
jgi:outer membrane protein TolC